MLRLIVLIAAIFLSCSSEYPTGLHNPSPKSVFIDSAPDWCNPSSIVVEGVWFAPFVEDPYGYGRKVPVRITADRISDCVYKLSISYLFGDEQAEDYMRFAQEEGHPDIQVSATDTHIISTCYMIIVSADDAGDLVTMNVEFLEESIGQDLNWDGKIEGDEISYRDRFLSEEEAPSKMKVWGDVMFWGIQYDRVLE